MKRLLLALTLLWSSLAFAQVPMTGAGKGNPGAAGPTNVLLLVAGGSNFVLQTDASSNICLAGGC